MDEALIRMDGENAQLGGTYNFVVSSERNESDSSDARIYDMHTYFIGPAARAVCPLPTCPVLHLRKNRRHANIDVSSNWVT